VRSLGRFLARKKSQVGITVYNADNFKKLTANYTLMRLLSAHRVTKYVGKISL